MKFKDSYHFYALTAVTCWALAYVLTRLALLYFSPFSLGFLRYFIASLILTAVALFTKMKLPRRADWPWFAFSGAAGFFLYMLFFNKGCQTVTAATSSLVISTAPVVTALLARLVYREKLSICKWLASALELSGVAIITLMNGIFSLNLGLLWLLAGVLLFSTYNLLQRRLTQTYSPMQAAAFSIFAGTLMLAIFLPASVSEVKSAPPIQLLYLAVLGIFPSAIAYVAWTQAFSKTKQSSSVSNYMFLTPVLTSILGFVIVHEMPDAATLTGGAVILFGLAMFNFGDKILARRLHRNMESGG